MRLAFLPALLIVAGMLPAGSAVHEVKLGMSVLDLETREIYDCGAAGLSAAQQATCALLAPTAIVPASEPSPLDRDQNPVGWKETQYFGGGTAAQSCGYYRAQAKTVACHLEYGAPAHVFAMTIYYCGCPENAEHTTSGSIHNYLDYPADTGFWVDRDHDRTVCDEYFSNNDKNSAGARGHVSKDESWCRTPEPWGLWGVGVYYEGGEAVDPRKNPARKFEYVYE